MTETESETESEGPCLHCELTKVIEEHMQHRIASGLVVNLADITDKIVEALGQFILEAVSPEERAKMIAYALEHLGQVLMSDEAERETWH